MWRLWLKLADPVVVACPTSGERIARQYNPCTHLKGRQFSQVSSYEALALEVEGTFKVLSELRRPEPNMNWLPRR
jgi:hypothetical protein